MSYVIRPGDLTALATTFFGLLQKPDEFTRFLYFLEAQSPASVLEIGFGGGGSAWAITKLQSVTRFISIDLPKGPWGGTDAAEKVLPHIAQGTDAQCYFIQGSSQNSDCVAEVERILEGSFLDVLFIDGDHSYAGVKTDFLTYSPFVKPGGHIVLHDICEHPPETKCEVRKFYLELKETWPKEKLVEIVTEPLDWGGLVILEKPGEPNE